MMEKISITYRGPLRDMTGRDGDETNASNIKDVLKFIKSAYGAEAHAAAKKMLIAVNGKSVLLLDNLSTRLSSGDTVSFLPIAGGG